MLHLIWALGSSVSMLRTCENCMGELGWPKCVGMLDWFNWMGCYVGWNKHAQQLVQAFLK